MTLFGLLHYLWEEAGLNQWNQRLQVSAGLRFPTDGPTMQPTTSVQDK